MICFVTSVSDTSLEVDVTTSTPSVAQGDTFYVTANILNSGSESATNVDVTLSLPEGLSTLMQSTHTSES